MPNLFVTLHDIQDFWDTEMQQSLFDFHLGSGIKANLAIVASLFGEDEPLVDKAKAGVQQGIFGIYNHTWDHADLTTLTKDEIKENIQKAQARLKDIFGLEPSVVVPPYWSINQDVVDVCAELGLQLRGLEPYTVHCPKWADGGWAQVQPEATRDELQQALQLYGMAELVVHHQGITDINLYTRTIELCLRPEWLDTVSSIVGLGAGLMVMGLVITLATRSFD